MAQHVHHENAGQAPRAHGETAGSGHLAGEHMAISSTIRLVATAIAAGTCLHASTAPLRVSDRVTGSVQQYTVRRGDTLTTLSARFAVGSDVIAAANSLEPGKTLVAGRILALDNRHVVPVPSDPRLEILINIPQRMLFLLRDGAREQSFPVAVGKSDWPTPTGPFHVVVKEVHPTWDVPVSIQDEMRRAGQRVITRMPPGPRNPLGDYWIGLSFGSLGIHGTPYPSTVYRFSTHGCLRMHPDDVQALFADVMVGTTGATVYEPVLLAVTADGIFLEANRDVYRREHTTLDGVRNAAVAAGLQTRIDWTAAAGVLRRREGVARLVSLRVNRVWSGRLSAVGNWPAVDDGVERRADGIERTGASWGGWHQRTRLPPPPCGRYWSAA